MNLKKINRWCSFESLLSKNYELTSVCLDIPYFTVILLCQGSEMECKESKDMIGQDVDATTKSEYSEV